MNTPLRITGNIWDVWGTVDCLCVTTNNNRHGDGALVMGRGIAGEAARKFPQLPWIAGGLVARVPGDYHFLTVSLPAGTLGLLQTKRDYWKASPARLVEQSLAKLSDEARKSGWRNVHLPLPGAGLGALKEETVWAMCDALLDSRFTVWTRK